MSFTIDFSAVYRKARQLQGVADQVPFALSRALNDAAEVTRKTLGEETWPRAVKVRNKAFMKAALTTRGERASKKVLRVTIYDKLGRGHLGLHAKGGTKQARGRLAIPSRELADRRTSRGMPARLKPTALRNTFVRGDAIFQRTGPKGTRLTLLYTLKATAKQPADVPFDRDFEATMRRELAKSFPIRMREAMKTRR